MGNCVPSVPANSEVGRNVCFSTSGSFPIYPQTFERAEYVAPGRFQDPGSIKRYVFLLRTGQTYGDANTSSVITPDNVDQIRAEFFKELGLTRENWLSFVDYITGGPHHSLGYETYQEVMKTVDAIGDAMNRQELTLSQDEEGQRSEALRKMGEYWDFAAFFCQCQPVGSSTVYAFPMLNYYGWPVQGPFVSPSMMRQYAHSFHLRRFLQAALVLAANQSGGDPSGVDLSPHLEQFGLAFKASSSMDEGSPIPLPKPEDKDEYIVVGEREGWVAEVPRADGVTYGMGVLADATEVLPPGHPLANQATLGVGFSPSGSGGAVVTVSNSDEAIGVLTEAVSVSASNTGVEVATKGEIVILVDVSGSMEGTANLLATRIEEIVTGYMGGTREEVRVVAIPYTDYQTYSPYVVVINEANRAQAFPQLSAGIRKIGELIGSRDSGYSHKGFESLADAIGKVYQGKISEVERPGPERDVVLIAITDEEVMKPENYREGPSLDKSLDQARALGINSQVVILRRGKESVYSELASLLFGDAAARVQALEALKQFSLERLGDTHELANTLWDFIENGLVAPDNREAREFIVYLILASPTPDYAWMAEIVGGVQTDVLGHVIEAELTSGKLSHEGLINLASALFMYGEEEGADILVRVARQSGAVHLRGVVVDVLSQSPAYIGLLGELALNFNESFEMRTHAVAGLGKYSQMPEVRTALEQVELFGGKEDPAVMLAGFWLHELPGEPPMPQPEEVVTSENALAVLEDPRYSLGKRQEALVLVLRDPHYIPMLQSMAANPAEDPTMRLIVLSAIVYPAVLQGNDISEYLGEIALRGEADNSQIVGLAGDLLQALPQIIITARTTGIY